jgi:hypothetical protein
MTSWNHTDDGTSQVQTVLDGCKDLEEIKAAGLTIQCMSCCNCPQSHLSQRCFYFQTAKYQNRMPTAITTIQYISQRKAETPGLRNRHALGSPRQISNLTDFYIIWYRRDFTNSHDNLHSAIRKNSDGMSDKIDSHFRVLKFYTVG